MEIVNERTGSRGRTFERSLSYSAAIGNSFGNCSVRSSIEIPNIGNTEVYNNEELKNRYRISQTYVEGKEIEFPLAATNETNDGDDQVFIDSLQYISSEDTDDEQVTKGLVMKIDVENNDSPKLSTPSTVRLTSNVSRPLGNSISPNEDLDSIEVEESLYTSIPETVTSTAHGYSTPYSKRKKSTKVRNRQVGRPIRSRRVVYKNGEENVPVRSNIPSKSMKYMRDIVTTIINSKWRFIILMMVFAHFFFWFLFAGIWYAVTLSYQDDIGDGKEHCVTGTSSFAGLLMMAVETQMTIGYGVRFPNEECPEAIVIMVLELVAGTALSGGLASLLFLKLVRPNKHMRSVGFSRKAAVCMRDGQLCLQFRVWDLMNLHIIGSNINAYMLKPIRTLEGELVQNYIHQLELIGARSLLLWPITMVHIIDDKSPLYDFSPQDMMDYRFEIVVSLTGSSKSMGTVTQSRTSYLSKEIIWGHRFKNVLNYSKKHESYVIDVDNLHTVEQVDTPLCSARHLEEIEEDYKCNPRNLITMYPTDTMSYIPEDSSTLSITEESVSTPTPTPTPNFTRSHSNQRSFGWSFRRFSSIKEPTISEARL